MRRWVSSFLASACLTRSNVLPLTLAKNVTLTCLQHHLQANVLTPTPKKAYAKFQKPNKLLKIHNLSDKKSKKYFGTLPARATQHIFFSEILILFPRPSCKGRGRGQGATILQEGMGMGGGGSLKVGEVSLAGQSERRHIAASHDVALLELHLPTGQHENWLGSTIC